MCRAESLAWLAGVLSRIDDYKIARIDEPSARALR